MNKWLLDFHQLISKYCMKKPRYSELRPLNLMGTKRGLD